MTPRKQRTNKKKSINRRRRSVLPPALTLNSHMMRSRIQTAWDISQGSLSRSVTHYAPALTTPTQDPSSWKTINFTSEKIFAHGWLSALRALFNEVKIHRITAHYVPYAPITDPGEYIFGLWDSQENGDPTGFSNLLGTPASVVRKSGQPAKLTWYPTEPEDRNWNPLNSDHQYCSAAIYAAEEFYNQDVPQAKDANTIDKQHCNIAGKIIVTVDSSFRGKPSSLKTTSRCTCRKCLFLLFSSRPKCDRLFSRLATTTIADSEPSSPFSQPDVPS